jgi:hypothetical protein
LRFVPVYSIQQCLSQEFCFEFFGNFKIQISWHNLLEKDGRQTNFELHARALYGVALAGRKPAAMRAHGGDKILFPLLVQ